jgi:hypothetical protein
MSDNKNKFWRIGARANIVRLLLGLSIACAFLMRTDLCEAACNSPAGQTYTLTVDSLTLYNSAGNEVSAVAFDSTDTFKATAKFSDTLSPYASVGQSQADTVTLSYSFSGQASGSDTTPSSDGSHSEDSTSTTLTTPGAQSITFTVSGPLSDCSATKTISIDVLKVAFDNPTVTTPSTGNGNTYDDAPNNLTDDSYDKSQLSWTMTCADGSDVTPGVDPSIDPDTGEITFGDGGGSYTVTATSTASGIGDADQPYDSYTLNVIELVFDNPTVYTAWTEDGSYNDAPENFTYDSYDTDNVKWSITPTDDGTSIDPDTGEITFGDGGGSYTVTATSTASGIDDADQPYASFALDVIQVVSIQPDPMSNLEEWGTDDSDDERVFLVPLGWRMEIPTAPVTVRAKIVPDLSESQLPANFTLQGGIGSAKLNRTVNRSFGNGASMTEFTFNCGGEDSGLKTTIYVYEADISLYSYADLPNADHGHSWVELTLDEDTTDAIIAPNLQVYLSTMGFHPVDNADKGQILNGISVPGYIALGTAEDEQDYLTPAWQKYHILIDPLYIALPEIDSAYKNPPDWNLYTYNCVNFAIQVGEAMDVSTMDDSGLCTPWEFMDWLNSNPSND